MPEPAAADEGARRGKRRARAVEMTTSTGRAIRQGNVRTRVAIRGLLNGAALTREKAEASAKALDEARSRYFGALEEFAHALERQAAAKLKLDKAKLKGDKAEVATTRSALNEVKKEVKDVEGSVMRERRGAIKAERSLTEQPVGYWQASLSSIPEEIANIGELKRRGAGARLDAFCQVLLGDLSRRYEHAQNEALRMDPEFWQQKSNVASVEMAAIDPRIKGHDQEILRLKQRRRAETNLVNRRQIDEALALQSTAREQARKELKAQQLAFKNAQAELVRLEPSGREFVTGPGRRAKFDITEG